MERVCETLRRIERGMEIEKRPERPICAVTALHEFIPKQALPVVLWVMQIIIIIVIINNNKM